MFLFVTNTMSKKFCYIIKIKYCKLKYYMFLKVKVNVKKSILKIKPRNSIRHLDVRHF